MQENWTRTKELLWRCLIVLIEVLAKLPIEQRRPYLDESSPSPTRPKQKLTPLHDVRHPAKP